MAFSFPDSAAAPLLFAACAAAWMLVARARGVARLHIHFAAMLFAALAAARLADGLFAAFAGVTIAVALFVVSLGGGALALALRAALARPVPPPVAALTLGLGFAVGLIALITGVAVVALAGAVLAACLILAAGLAGFADHPRRAALSWLTGLALACGALALADDAVDRALLFFAAGLIGAAAASAQSRRSSSSADGVTARS